MTIENSTLPKSTEAREIPHQLRAWLEEKRSTLAEWDRRQNLNRKHCHDDARHKRLALAEIELGGR